MSNPVYEKDVVQKTDRLPEVEQAVAEVNKVIERMTESPAGTRNIQIEKIVVDASKGGYEVHPEAYSPRVFIYVQSTDIHYELLKTGEAIPWVSKSPEGKGFDFWIMDVARLSDVGVHRAT
jgi:hypothetical protein